MKLMTPDEIMARYQLQKKIPQMASQAPQLRANQPSMSDFVSSGDYSKDSDPMYQNQGEIPEVVWDLALALAAGGAGGLIGKELAGSAMGGEAGLGGKAMQMGRKALPSRRIPRPTPAAAQKMLTGLAERKMLTDQSWKADPFFPVRNW